MVRRRRGRVDSAPARSARRGQAGPRAARDLARLHPHRGPHPQRHLGRQADVEPDTAAAAARRRPARPVRRRTALRDPRCRRQRSGSGPCLPSRRCVPSGVVLAGGADPGLARQARPGARLPRRVSRRRRSRTSSRCCATQEKGWRSVVRRGGHQADGSLLSGAVAQPHPSRRHRPRGARAGPAARAGAGAGTPGRSTIRRMGGPLPGRRGTRRAYRHDRDRDRPTTRCTSTNCGCWRPRPCTSSARWSPSWSGRCCCSRRARTRSCCCGWRRRLFGPSRCPSR